MSASRAVPSLLLALLLAGCSQAGPDAPAGADAAAAADAQATAATRDTVAATAADALPDLASLVTAQDTLASLQARLGAANVVAEELPGAEGETFPGWVLFPNDPSRRLQVHLDEAGEHPMMLMADEQATAWQRADGIRIGLDSKALEALNAGAFRFFGFEWDYGGTIVDWNGGAIAPGGEPAGMVALCAPEAARRGDVPDYPSGDSEFSSDLPSVRAHPPVVCRFGLNIAPSAG